MPDQKEDAQLKPEHGIRPSMIFIQLADGINGRWQGLVSAALLMRVAVLTMMALSCYLVPDFVSGDDSLQKFDLRLRAEETSFALEHSFCHCFFHCTTGDASASLTPLLLPVGDQLIPTAVWDFFLMPLTRWDAARFLKLAHEPLLRHPRRRLALSSPRTPQTNDEETCADTMNETFVQEAEEAHAFLPLFPLAVQFLTRLLLSLLPMQLLPPTCEALLALSAWLLNTVCFAWSALAMYHLTKAYLEPKHAEAKLWATRVSVLFIINPANVFFGTAYSEALGSTLVFTACWLFAKFQMAKELDFNSCVLFVLSWWFLMMSCWVRSNGIVYAGFLFLYGVGCASHALVHSKLLRGCFALSVLGLFGIVLFVGGISTYNYIAVQRVCKPLDHIEEQSQMTLLSSNFESPLWCNEGNRFNMYSYIQRRHWGVGPFRYYEMNQIPNFLLAAPVLALSVYAVTKWIKQSFHRRRSARMSWTGIVFVDWVLNAFSELGAPTQSGQSAEIELVGGEALLGHYAVLAASALVVLVLAHVQIGTRLILSTCPAIYWYLVAIICRCQRTGDTVLVWCVLYNLLGALLHPNWLPWT